MGQHNCTMGRGKQSTTWIANLSEWMVDQYLGAITKNIKLIKNYKGQEIVESYVHLCLEGTWRIEDVEEVICCLRQNYLWGVSYLKFQIIDSALKIIHIETYKCVVVFWLANGNEK